MQRVFNISALGSCLTENGNDLKHSVQVSTTNGTPLRSLPFLGIQTGAVFLSCPIGPHRSASAMISSSLPASSQPFA
jgi:hypothetical protein